MRRIRDYNNAPNLFTAAADLLIGIHPSKRYAVLVEPNIFFKLLTKMILYVYNLRADIDFFFLIPRHSSLTRQPYAPATDVLVAGLLEEGSF